MSVRKIKANRAVIEGDYVLIEKFSYRTHASIVFLLLGIIGFFYHFPLAVLGAAGGVVFSLLLVPGKEIRQIPRVDVLEIKHYPSDRRVTVVLDDERTKRRQPVTVKK